MSENIEEMESEDVSLADIIKDIPGYNDLDAIEDESESIISAVVEDGNDAELSYEIEHIFTSTEFTKLEKFIVKLVELLGDDVQVEEPEEGKEGRITFYTVNVITEHKLNLEEIMTEIKSFISLCNEYSIIYDAWGTQVE